MAFNNTIQGGVSGRLAEVDVNNQLAVALSTDMTKAGVVRIYAENDPGAIIGAATGIPPEASDNFRLACGQDNSLDSESFNYAAQNTSKYAVRTTTQTLTFNSQYFQTNGGGIVTVATGCLLSTYGTFAVVGSSGLFVEINSSFTAFLATNTTIDFGLFTAPTATPYAPTDGVFFRANAVGLQGVSSFNGVEQVTPVFVSVFGGANFTPNTNQFYKFGITYCKRHIKFWVNDVLSGELTVASGSGQMTLSSQLPISVRHAIAAGAASVAMSMRVADYCVTSIDLALNTAAPIAAANSGFSAYQGIGGGTMGTTAQLANSTNPAAAVPLNISAALGSGLGGNFWHTNTFAVNTDGIISSFQNPVLTLNNTAKQLIITGIRIDTGVQTTLANIAGAIYVWSLAYGHTAVSLATTETATTKAPRRIALGVQGAIGALAQGASLTVIDRDFSNGPIVVNPGEFIQTVVKNIGTVGTAGVLTHVITFIGYWK